MVARFNGEIRGTKEAIKSLRQIDPDLRKQFTKDARVVAQPIIDAAKAAYPERLLSGMARPWTQGENQKFPYSQSKAKSGVKFKVDTRRKSGSAIKVQQTNPAAAIADIAGKSNANTLGQNLNRYGRPSRFMWPAAEKNLDAVTRRMTDLVKDVMETVSKELK